jgi:WD40 repeat protein
LICIWDIETGMPLAHLNGHRNRVTTLQFVTDKKLVSAGNDKLVILWELGDDGSPRGMSKFPGRSGDVPTLGVDPNTNQVLFDRGKELSLVSLLDRQPRGSLQNYSGAMTFTTMAVFSPNGQLIMTYGASENRLQLWRTPNAKSRGYELRQLIWKGAPITCGAFAPDNSFAVTATQDGQIVPWILPSKEDIEQQLTAHIVTAIPTDTGYSRILLLKAEMENPGYLSPGDKASMVAYPKQ